MQSDQSCSDAWLCTKQPLDIDVASFNMSDLKETLAVLEQLEVDLGLMDRRLSRMLKRASRSTNNGTWEVSSLRTMESDSST
jgi:hypothetical protein